MKLEEFRDIIEQKIIKHRGVTTSFEIFEEAPVLAELNKDRISVFAGSPRKLEISDNAAQFFLDVAMAVASNAKNLKVLNKAFDYLFQESSRWFECYGDRWVKQFKDCVKEKEQVLLRFKDHYYHDYFGIKEESIDKEIERLRHEYENAIAPGSKSNTDFRVDGFVLLIFVALGGDVKCDVTVPIFDEIDYSEYLENYSDLNDSNLLKIKSMNCLIAYILLILNIKKLRGKGSPVYKESTIKQKYQSILKEIELSKEDISNVSLESIEAKLKKIHSIYKL